MANKTNPWIIGIIIVGVLFFLGSGTQFFGALIPIDTPLIQFMNKPIQAKFELGNLTGTPEFSVTHNGNEINFTSGDLNGTFIVTAEVFKPGIFKVFATREDITESLTIHVERPFVTIEQVFPATVDKGETVDLKVITTNPQGELVDVDLLEVVYTDPNNIESSFEMDKISEGNYKKTFTFEKDGSYIFTITPRKAGFETKEQSVPVQALGFADLPGQLFLAIGAIALFIILVIRKRFFSRG